MSFQFLCSLDALAIVSLISKALGICSILLGLTYAGVTFKKKANGWKYLLFGLGGFVLMICVRYAYAFWYFLSTNKGGTAVMFSLY
jgi:hypothetical protein